MTASISGDMKTTLSNSQKSTKQLEISVKTQKGLLNSQKDVLEIVKSNSDATTIMLQESREAVQLYDVKIWIAFDPMKIDEILNHQLLDEQMRKALTESSPLSLSVQRLIYEALEKNHRKVLDILLELWHLTFEIKKLDQEDRILYSQELFFNAEQATSTYFISPNNDIKSNTGYPTASCIIRYTIPLSGIPLLKTFRDLNGARIYFSLSAKPDMFCVRQAHANLGAGGGGYRFPELLLYAPIKNYDWSGGWSKIIDLPKDYYKNK